MKRKISETEPEPVPKIPETIDDILEWANCLQKQDINKLYEYIKDEIDIHEFEYCESLNDDDINEIFSSYKFDMRAVKIIRAKPALQKLNKMIGMKSIKKTVVDLILYYTQDFHRKNEDYLHTVITGPPGCGKCLAPETLIRTFTGDLIMAKDVEKDMYLMGEYGEPKRVLATTKEYNETLTDQMFRIKQSHGEDYIVNSEHILSLIQTKSPRLEMTHDGYTVTYVDYEDVHVRHFKIKTLAETFKLNVSQERNVIDIGLTDYLKRSNRWKSWYRGYRSVVEYFKGMYIDERLNWVKSVANDNGIYAEDQHVENIVEIIHSLGWSCDVSKLSSESLINILGEKFSKLSSESLINILGEKFSKLKVEPLEVGEYVGFELERISGFGEPYDNCRFLLKDFTVTHNTTVAEIIGEIYAKLGILETTKFKHLSRSDLIAEYLGQSAIKTKKALTACIGGVAFIDEAYSLAPNKKDNDSFAKEVIDTLNQFLSEHKDDFVCILAGYKDDLQSTFFAMNKGLERRFPWRFDIESYTPKDMTEILNKKINDMDWKNNVESDWLESFFQENQAYFKHFGGDIETFLTKCKFAHVRRVFVLEESNKKIFMKDDFEKGFEEHKLHYEKEEEESVPPLGMYS